VEIRLSGGQRRRQLVKRSRATWMYSMPSTPREQTDARHLGRWQATQPLIGSDVVWSISLHYDLIGDAKASPTVRLDWVGFPDLHRAISIRPGPPAPWRVRESASGTAMESPAKSPRAVVNQRQIATGTDTPVSQIAPHPLGHFHASDCHIRWLRRTRTGLENRSLRKGTGGSNPPLSARF
jgi:hypothetical protein